MPENKNVILEVQDLKMKFGKLEVLKGVTTTIRRGEVIVVIGASGAGKSTFLRCLNRLETPTSGDILFEGESVVHAGRNLNHLRERMGMVFQQFNLFNNLNVLNNITLAPTIVKKADKAASEEEAMKLLARVGLQDKAKAYPDTLSGGEQQRVAVARALAHGPKLVIADEPTGNIDPELSLEMMELLERVSEMGITVVVVTHEHELVRQFHQRVVTLKKGRIISDVPADKEAIRERAEHRERLFETELEPENTAEKEAATV